MMKSKILMATVCLSALMTTEVYGSFREEYNASVQATTATNEVRDAANIVGVPAVDLLTELDAIYDAVDGRTAGNLEASLVNVRTAIDNNNGANLNALGAINSIRTVIDNSNAGDALTATNNVRTVIDNSAGVNALAAVNNLRDYIDGSTNLNALGGVNDVRARLVAVPGAVPADNVLVEVNAAINLVNGAGAGAGADLTTSLDNHLATLKAYYVYVQGHGGVNAHSRTTFGTAIGAQLEVDDYTNIRRATNLDALAKAAGM